MTALLVVALIVQFRTRRYVPPVYWIAVVLISIVGTLITDNLTDKYGVALELTTSVFAVGLVRRVRWLHVNEVLAFWAAYILTQPSARRSATSSPNPRRTAARASVRPSRASSSSD